MIEAVIWYVLFIYCNNTLVMFNAYNFIICAIFPKYIAFKYKEFTFNVVCFDSLRAHVSLNLATREWGILLDSQKNSTHLFWCVVKCQGIGEETGSKVRNSGGQVPYIWTSVGRSGLQCWGKMMRKRPFLGPRWLTPEPEWSKRLF